MLRKLCRGLRKLYTTAIVGFVVYLAIRVVNDPQTTELWNYITAPQHSPLEYLVIATFVLVLLDRLEKMLAAWGAAE